MKYRKKIAAFFSVLAIASYLSFLFNKPQQEVVKVSSEPLDTLQVYLLDKDDLLTPLSIEIAKDQTMNQRIELMFAYLSGKQKINGYQPLFHQEVQPVKMQYKDQILHYYFDQSFLKYDKEKELSVLEALVYSSTAIEGVKEIKLYLNNQPLIYMPLTRIKIHEHLNREIGINHFESVASLHDSYMITMYYKKNNMFVPKSVRVNEKITDVERYVIYLLKDITVSSLLSQPLVKEEIQINSVKYQDGICEIDVNHNMLASDQSIKDDLFMILKLALKDQGVKQIKLSVNHQIMKDEAIEDKIVYNVVDFE